METAFQSSMCPRRVHLEKIHQAHIRCVGVFDTVGSLGLPEELALGSKRIKTLFGFPDSVLGDHVERAYQALALNEIRADFVRPCHVSHTSGVLTCPELQQFSAFRRGEKEEASVKAGTVNAQPHTLRLTEITF
jgi:hypothetical protein